MFKDAKILVATDMISDGNLVRKLLEEEFDNIKVSSIQIIMLMILIVLDQKL